MKLGISEKSVLRKSVFSIMDKWSLTMDSTMKIIGLEKVFFNNGDISDQVYFEYDSKEYQNTLLFIRAFQLLEGLLGSSLDNHKSWLDSFNRSLNTTPIELLKAKGGLKKLVDFLESFNESTS